MNPPLDLATVEAPFFEPLTGQKFSAQSLEGEGQPPLELELLHVQTFHHRPETAGRAPFALLFKPGESARLAQGLYDLAGPGLAQTQVFLVPVRDPLRGICFEAVFN